MEHDDRASEDAPPPADSAADDTVPEQPVPRRRHRRWPWVLVGVILSPLILLALWTVVALNYSYSQGNRAGYVQKFSKKGWLCKTWEGELAMVTIPGTMPKQWEFTVRDDSIARIITQSMGSRLSLEYREHRGVPTTCFGDTQYFVDGARILGP
jgi:hypothetical protein